MKREWLNSDDIAKRGFATFYIQQFSFGGKPFDSFGTSKAAGTARLRCYESKLDALDAYAERFRRVLIESLDWRDVVEKYDREDALFYFDPPYICNTDKMYRKDLRAVNHREVVDVLLRIQGRAALSCYYNNVYQPLINAGWTRRDWNSKQSVQRSNDATAKRERVETLLISPERNKQYV